MTTQEKLIKRKLSIPLQKGARKPTRRLETPSKTQAEVLSAFGHRVDESGVLQTIN